MVTSTDIASPRGLWRRVLKVVLGVLFVVSAVLKIIDIDPFEIYVYSYGFFGLDMSFLVARAAIILELVLGICLIFNLFHKLIWWSSLLMLLGYTGLMAYALWLGRTDHCHCFGEWFQLDPLRSLIKNLVLLLWLAMLYPVKGRSFRGQFPVLAGVALACTVAVFAVSPPDSMLRQDPSGKVVRQDLLETALHEGPLAGRRLDEGKKLLGFFSTGCDLCKMAARKLSLMQSFCGFPEQDVCYVFMGTETGVARFFDESESTRYPYVLYDDAVPLLRLIDGKFPTVVLLENGVVAHEYGLRDMDEAEIKYFFLN